MTFKQKRITAHSLSPAWLKNPASSTPVDSCPKAALHYHYFMIQPLLSFCQGRFTSLYVWRTLTSWQGPHHHLWLKLRSPNGTSFNDALRIVISDLGCMTCQKRFNLPWVKGSHIYAGVFPDKQLVIFHSLLQIFILLSICLITQKWKKQRECVLWNQL